MKRLFNFNTCSTVLKAFADCFGEARAEPSRRPIHSRGRLYYIALLFVPCLCGVSFAQDGDASYHFNRNPFVTKSSGPVIQQQTANSVNYHFNGYVRTGNRIQVMIENQGRPYRLFVGENREGVSVREAKVDGDNKYVVLTVGDETFRLDLAREPNPSSMPPTMTQPMMPSMPLQMPQSGPPMMDPMNPMNTLNPEVQMNPGQQAPPSAPRRRIIVPRRAQ